MSAKQTVWHGDPQWFLGQKNDNKIPAVYTTNNTTGTNTWMSPNIWDTTNPFDDNGTYTWPSTTPTRPLVPHDDGGTAAPYNPWGDESTAPRRNPIFPSPPNPWRTPSIIEPYQVPGTGDHQPWRRNPPPQPPDGYNPEESQRRVREWMERIREESERRTRDEVIQEQINAPIEPKPDPKEVLALAEALFRMEEAARKIMLSQLEKSTPAMHKAVVKAIKKLEKQAKEEAERNKDRKIDLDL